MKRRRVPAVRRWVDAAGHAWPVTGAMCAVCQLPVIAAGDDLGVHPTCSTEGGER